MLLVAQRSQGGLLGYYVSFGNLVLRKFSRSEPARDNKSLEQERHCKGSPDTLEAPTFAQPTASMK